MLLFHAQIEPREAEELVRSDEVDGGGFAYQHESLAGADAIAAAGDGMSVSTGLGGGGAVATQQRVTAERDEVRPQRSLLVREWEEVQEVSRRVVQ